MSKLFHTRMAGWLFTAILLLIASLLIAPQQLPVTIYKLLLVSLAGGVCWWLDRELFPYARPDAFMAQPFSPGAPYVPGRAVQPGMEIVFAAAMIRRAIIVGAGMLSIGLGM